MAALFVVVLSAAAIATPACQQEKWGACGGASYPQYDGSCCIDDKIGWAAGKHGWAPTEDFACVEVNDHYSQCQPYHEPPCHAEETEIIVDTDGSGTISKAEYVAAGLAMGCAGLHDSPTYEADAHNHVDKHDADGDGEISPTEHLNMITHQQLYEGPLVDYCQKAKGLKLIYPTPSSPSDRRQMETTYPFIKFTYADLPNNEWRGKYYFSAGSFTHGLFFPPTYGSAIPWAFCFHPSYPYADSNCMQSTEGKTFLLPASFSALFQNQELDNAEVVLHDDSSDDSVISGSYSSEDNADDEE